MKILYISHLLGGGPDWSVPASVKAQSFIDDVLWINMTDSYMEHWGQVDAYHNIREIGKLSLSRLPKKFRNPDLVVFEGIYFIENVLFSYSLQRRHIPYIIVPRSSLTIQAQNNAKWLKKKIFNILAFNAFAKKALAIQYLTKDELKASSTKWNERYFIVPNGVVIPESFKTNFCKERKICGLFIGRIDIYQKGLDLLVEACRILQNELRNDNFVIKINGPDHEENRSKLQYLLKQKGVGDIIELGDAVSGKEKEDIMLQSDFFIMTSRFEGHPMALIEALSYGLPCVVTQGTNMREEICKYNAGWGCSNTIEDISSTLLEVIKDKKKLRDKSICARTLVSKYDLGNLAKEFHNSIEAFLHKNKYTG